MVHIRYNVHFNIQKTMSILSIAPMIDWSYTHFRVFMRLLAPESLCYTEMQTVQAIQHQPKRALDFHVSELGHLVLQLGGADPKALAQSAKMAETLGFSEINLNLGCPSDRVQQGKFGACLMYEPSIVGACIAAMKDAVTIPVTAKTRIGVDDHESYDFLYEFVSHIIEKGCDKLVMHARKAWLKGLSPKQNRTIPPLHYETVYKIKSAFPNTPVIINGNIQRKEISTHLHHVDGVMFGRLACDDPYQIAHIHNDLFPHSKIPTRSEVLLKYIKYLQNIPKTITPNTALIIRPLLNIAHGLPQNKNWKKELLLLKRWDHWAAWERLIITLQTLEKGAYDGK
jgi:tRNA-dihydrouridine synthase A